MEELREIHGELEKCYQTFTKQYVESAALSLLDVNLKTVETLKQAYLEKYDKVNKSSLNIEQTAIITVHNKNVTSWAGALIKGMRTQIEKLKLTEEKKAKEKAQQERDTANQLLTKTEEEKNTALSKVKELEEELKKLQLTSKPENLGEGSSTMATQLDQCIVEKETEQRYRRQAETEKQNAEEILKQKEDLFNSSRDTKW